MGGNQSAQAVCSFPENENITPFTVRRPINYPNGPKTNPPDIPTMKELLLESYRKYAKSPYLGEREFENGDFSKQFKWKTYEECEQIARSLGSGLASIGIKVGSMIGVYSPNNYAWLHCIDASCLF